MTKRELLERIEALERRIAQLEARPIPMPYITPYVETNGWTCPYCGRWVTGSHYCATTWTASTSTPAESRLDTTTA